MRRARYAAGLKASEVFARAGVHPTHLSRIENGRRYLAPDTLSVLASLYGVALSNLVGPGDVETMRGGQLSPHLSCEEFIASENTRFSNRNRSQWHARADHRENGRWLAGALFEPVRAVLGVPLRIVGGYRAQDTHRVILIEGDEVSGHIHALAIDVIPVGLELADALSKLRRAADRGRLESLDFATVEYGRWIHIQAPPFNRAARNIVIPTTGP